MTINAIHFQQALGWLDEDEGGYSNRSKKADPGGETNMGITHRVYTAWLKRQKRPNQSVKYITRDEAHAIYKSNYWRPLAALEDDPALRICVFDSAVTSGVSRAVKILQKVLGVKQDAVIGAITLAAIEGRLEAGIISEYCAARIAYMKRLKNWKYNPGWEPRVDRVEARCTQYSRLDGVTVTVAPEPGSEKPVYMDGKAEDPDRESPAKSRTIQGAVAAGVSGVGGTIAAISQLDGTVQLALIGAAVVCVLGVALVFRERLLKWSDGDR